MSDDREYEEQCRIIGMSAERELFLRAENDRLRARVAELEKTNGRLEARIAGLQEERDRPICRDCGNPIERGAYRDPLWVKLWCMEKQSPIYYHRSCWNRRVAAELRREDEWARRAAGR